MSLMLCVPSFALKLISYTKIDMDYTEINNSQLLSYQGTTSSIIVTIMNLKWNMTLSDIC